MPDSGLGKNSSGLKPSRRATSSVFADRQEFAYFDNLIFLRVSGAWTAYSLITLPVNCGPQNSGH